MVSTLNLDEKYNRVRRNFCFYLDIQDHGLARSISRRIQDMGLQQEVFLTSRVTHVVRSRGASIGSGGSAWGPGGGAAGLGAGAAGPGGGAGVPGGGAAGPGGGAARWARREGRARADAMLERVRPDPPHRANNHKYVQLTVHKAISLLDKLYDTFFTASRKAHVTLFTKHFIKIEFLDKLCRPIYKEFDEWPEISLEPDPPKEKKKETPEKITTNNNQNTKDTTIEKMTRKSRPRIKEREEKEVKGGYCEMCNSEYVDATLHRRSPHHAAFVRDHGNFLALDSLIGAGADVASFLDKATPLNGERRSLRNVCNGELGPPRGKRSRRSQSPDSALDGAHSPRRNGLPDDDRKHNTRCSKRANDALSEDRQYYKVVGVSTKLRSSGGFSNKRKDSPPTCNGTKPLVVKFRKVRRSELSVLSDEAEQFMFPKRASSTSSTSSDDEDKELGARRKCSPLPPPPSAERRRQARPLALKEESSEEDSWPEDKRRRKKRAPIVAKRARRVPCKSQSVEPESSVETPEIVEQIVPAEPPAPPDEEISPLREEPIERCMKWEDGKLKYTPAVEQLEFAFESVPQSEPWFETFKRQDEDKVLTKNIPQYFALYSKSPKLPYEIGQLPPLKPNCCPLSDLGKHEDKAGPSRSYGTRGMKKQKIRKRTAALLALEGHPRKSPREHASTLAILGSAGLIHRRKHADDSKSTASEDTISDTHSNVKVDSVLSETQDASERLQQFLSEVFEDAAEYEVSEEVMDGEAAVTTSTNVPDVSSLMSECDNCDIIRNEMKEAADRPKGRRGKFKKKNRTGWPNKKKQNKKSSRTSSVESENKVDSSLDRSSAEPPDDDTTQDTISEGDTNNSETEKETTVIEKSKLEGSQDMTLTEITIEEQCDSVVCDSTQELSNSKDKTLQKLKVLEEKAKDEEKEERKLRSETEDKDGKKKKRALLGLADWLQPVVRVARVERVGRVGAAGNRSGSAGGRVGLAGGRVGPAGVRLGPAAARRLRSGTRARPARHR